MYKSVIGLEIHVELKTKSKMFCNCVNDPSESRPNVRICPTCLGHPGTLPVINKEAVRKTIKTGLTLNCSIPEKSKFDRKNYFYPDLPKGYQISQYDMPFCEKGYLEINGKKIRITRVHLEEDTGRLIHQEKDSLVDFNRAGIPLMEMVTEPDLSSGQEARKFAQELRLILRYLNVSNADMEKGQMRVEVNISLSKDKKLGTKVEIKNLNSFRSVERSIDYEIKRQTELLNRGEKIIQETRGWDEKKQKTNSQREKEQAHDYRYFPEPDLPTLEIDKKFVQEIKGEIPELPWAKRIRLKQEYGLDEKSIEVFVNNKDLGEYFEKVMSELRNWVKEIEMKEKITAKEFSKLTQLALNYIITDFWSLFGKALIVELENRITPENFAELITLIYKGEISSKIAKQVLKQMFDTKADPSHIIKEKGLSQVTDTGEIEKVIKEVISKNPKPVEDYKKGKENALQYLVGQVMAKTQGRAKPDTVQELLKKFL
jgi:aspartyl-tRNA(Asn)/glutamyl-tRNA(Gln) amidotransferase subunit B